MDTNTLRTVLIYTTGITVGGVLGAVAGALLADKLTAEDIATVTLEAAWIDNPDGTSSIKEISIIPDKEPEVEVDTRKEKRKKLDRKKLKEDALLADAQEGINYASFASKTRQKVDLNEMALIAEKYKVTPKNGEAKIDPTIISLDEYDQARLDKASLTYYEENEDVVENAKEIVGTDFKNRFGGISGDPDVVYVANPQLGIMYEIIRIHNSYSEVVQGIPTTKKKKRVRSANAAS